ncbi:MAG: cytochrome P450 [Micropepsaceae bacterium]
MSEVLNVPAMPRDPKRPAQPFRPVEPDKPRLRDIAAFFLRARRNLLTAFSHTVYQELMIRRGLFGQPVWIVSDPEAVKRILLDNAGNYPKGAQQQRRLKPAVGDGLLTAGGDSWRWQRRTTAPAFQHRKIVAFAPAMTAAALEMLTAWEAEGAAERDVADDMMRLTYDVLSRTVFGADARTDAKKMGDAFGRYFDTLGKLDLASFLNLPEWIPTVGRMKARPVLRYFNAEIGRIVNERRALLARDAGAAPDDLLTMLLTATDPEDGRPMDDRQVIDNVITFIGAGHETTANALCWTLYLLSEFPWADARIQDELTRVLNGRLAEAEDVAKLTYTRQVIEEAMRLYPPAPFLVREALEPDELAGFPVKAGTQVVVSPWIVHRHERLWDEPALFDPERFAPGRREAIHRFAYFPFGAGPRICIGMAFAMQEAVLLLATMLQRYRFEVVAPDKVDPYCTITLRPRGGMKMRIVKR